MARFATTLGAVGAATLAAAAALTLLKRQRRRLAQTCRVAVASTAQQKLDAVAKAMDAIVVGTKVPSLVSDQPLGLDETMRGAKNRLLALVEQTEAVKDCDFAVSVENGLVKMAPTTALDLSDTETWVDIAVVVVRDLASGKEICTTSAGVQFPNAAVGDWAEAGSEGTVGEVLAEELKCDKQDPHAALTKGAFPRAALLEHAVRLAQAAL